MWAWESIIISPPRPVLSLHYGFFVALSAFESLFENVPGFDPLLRFVVHLFGIRLEDDALAGTEHAGIHDVVEPLRELALVIMRVLLMIHVDLHLSASQRAVELFD